MNVETIVKEMDFSKDSLELTQFTNDHISPLKSPKDSEKIDISAWEKWMIDATRKDRERRKSLLVKKEEEELKRQQEQRKAKERRKKGDQCHKEWSLRKQQLLKTEREEKEKKLREERLKSIQKEEEKKQKANENYKKWCKMKDEAKLKQKLLENQKENEKLSKRQQRQSEAEIAYKRWLDSTSKEERHKCWWRGQSASSGNDTFSISTEWIGPLDETY